MMVISLLSEAYMLMFFVLLHLSFFACDNSCSLGISEFSDSFPAFVKTWTLRIINDTGLTSLQMKAIAQFVFLGDIFICFVTFGRVLGSLLRKFLAIFISLAISIWLFRKLQVI